MHIDAFRDEFPVLARVAYMNTGTDGPIPARAVRAAEEAIAVELEHGRSGKAQFERFLAGREALRERIAVFLACAPDDVALTNSATDGVNAALHALELGPGDEVVTTDEEHPGVLAPLGLAQRRGVKVRVVPWDELAGSVGSGTKLIACSHVSWITGRVADTDALKATGVPVLYDGAQGLGAIPVDVEALGCDFYAAAGQKWMCGPDGTGYLYVRRDRCEELDSPWPGFLTIAADGDALALDQAVGARRFDVGTWANGACEWATAACDLFGEFGVGAMFERATGLAAQLARMLAERGLTVAPRGRSTLVAWQSDDPEADVERLAARDIVVRNLPGRGLVRASVGAWATEEELERLVGAVA